MKCEIITEDAISFISALHDELGPMRVELLARRAESQARIDAGDFSSLGFTTSFDRTEEVVKSGVDGRIELTSPPYANMIAKGLASGADAYIADFDDSLSPTWWNVKRGHANLVAALPDYLDPEVGARGSGRVATELFFRPRGIHLEEKHVDVGRGRPGAAVFDVGLILFNLARRLLEGGRPVCFYLPKMESEGEALYWELLMERCEGLLSLPAGSVKVAVTIESVPGVFRLTQILDVLEGRNTAVNCGRWDYLFSHIKTFRNHHGYRLPGREQIHPESSVLRMLSSIVIGETLRRGLRSIGFMSAYIPARANSVANNRAHRDYVREKIFEIDAGFDGTWVAHPSLVAECRELFRSRRERSPSVIGPLTGGEAAAGLLLPPAGGLTRCSVEGGIRVCLHYFSRWRDGYGAIRLDDRMEDTATAEICRCQVWQALHMPGDEADGPLVDMDFVIRVLEAELSAVEGDLFSGYRHTADLLIASWRSPAFENSLTETMYDEMD